MGLRQEASLYVDKVLLSRLGNHPGTDSKNGGQPRDFADPLDADTDGDGMRAADESLPGSAGYLTDGWERTIHTNPFGIDSDEDADLLTPGELDPKYLDDADDNPLSDDNDADGIKDIL